jgi:hypothetical protein
MQRNTTRLVKCITKTDYGNIIAGFFKLNIGTWMQDSVLQPHKIVLVRRQGLHLICNKYGCSLKLLEE